MIKLWGRANSVNVQKPLWALDEIGLPYERVDAGLQYGRVDTPEYRAMNPNGKIPVLQDGDFVLSESNTITRYLCRRYAADRLCPPDLESQAFAEQWMDWVSTEVQSALSPVYRGLIRTPEAQRDMPAIESGLRAIDARLMVLDSWLADRRYIAGDGFGMGDIVVGAVIARCMKMPVTQIERPGLDRWLAEITARPAFSKSLDHALT